ncbi:MAG: cation transporter [Armatimonadetes bacterium]|nr:cation transporter [Armatimonadota bacterium]
MQAGERTQLAQRAATVSLVSTTVVVAFKLVAAAVSGSIAVLAEGLQSTLDVAMSMAALWAIRVAAKPPDRDHPYGHGKAEVLLSAFQMVLVVLTAGVIAWQAALRLHDPQPIRPDFGVAAMGYSVVANSLVVLYLRRAARSTGSAALAGESAHLVGDTFASLGVLVGLLTYIATGWRVIDPLVAILFTGLGALFALRQLRSLLHPLMDGSLPPDELSKISAVLDAHPESRGYHNVRTRDTGLLRIVSLHVMLDDHLSFVAAHDIAEQIEKELSSALGGALVTLHYEPFEAELEHRRREHDG